MRKEARPPGAHCQLERAHTASASWRNFRATGPTPGARPLEQIGAAYDYRHKRIILVQGAIETCREQLVLAHEPPRSRTSTCLHLPARSDRPKARSPAGRDQGTATRRRPLREGLPQRSCPGRATARGAAQLLWRRGSTPTRPRPTTSTTPTGPCVRSGPSARMGAGEPALRRPPTRTQEILHPRVAADPAPQPVRFSSVLPGPIGAWWGAALPASRTRWRSRRGCARLGGKAGNAAVRGRFQPWRARGDAALGRLRGGQHRVVGFR
jgi:hypothetical protein